jgi:D-3-phosphoglycerate dehydrogenase
MASMGLNFGLKISILDPYTQVESLPKNITLEKDLLVAIKKADFISFHLPAADKPILGANEIALLKPNCVILNTSRGGIIDDTALAQALRENRILGAGIDVFEEEPLNPNNVYSNLDNVILTPHSAGMAYESAERMAVGSVQNVLNFFNEKLDYSLVVNKNDIRL